MSATATDRAFVIARRFAAPREMVFRAWTEAEQLKRWFGPKGSAMAACTMDLRPGGIFHYCLEMPDGQWIWGRWLFREIVTPERIVLLQSFSDGTGGVARNPWNANWPLEILSTTSFEASQDGTLMTVTWRPYEASETERRAFEAGFESMNMGWSGTLDRLDAYLAQH